MALDWKKEVSFAGLAKSKGKKKNDSFPSKTHMNLAATEKKDIDVKRYIIIGVIAVIIVALFAKFGVYDFINRVNERQMELNKQEQSLSKIQVELKDYDAVLAEYGMYSSVTTSGDDISFPARDVLNLVNSVIAPKATVSSVSLKGDTLTLVLTNVNLADTGALTTELYKQDLVSEVSVSTAATQQSSEDVAATMKITLSSAES